ncbi:MAG TPA: ATP-dependent Clp protease adaptor ClpS [Kofleriaceae bacterium]
MMEVLGIILASASLALFGVQVRRLARVQRVKGLLAPIDTEVDIALHVANHAATSRAQALAPAHLLYGLVQDETFVAALARVGGDATALEGKLLDALETAPATSTEPYAPENAPFAIVAARVYARHHDRATQIADLWQAIAKSACADWIGPPPARLSFALIHGEAEPRAMLPGETAVHVVLKNDDYTTFEFVTSILREVFELTADAAQSVTLATHRDGHAIVGRFDTATAKRKVEEAWARATTERFPLWVSVEVC